MAASFSKLKDGTWGVRVTHPVAAGDTVTVTKKDGSTSTATVAKVLWTADGVSLCSIGGAAGGSRGARGTLYGRRTGCQCGSVEGRPKDSDCWECRHDA